MGCNPSNHRAAKFRFLLEKLRLDHVLRDQENAERDISEALNTFPDNQIDVYTKIMNRIVLLPEKPQTQAFHILCWVLSAQREHLSMLQGFRGLRSI